MLGMLFQLSAGPASSGESDTSEHVTADKPYQLSLVATRKRKRDLRLLFNSSCAKSAQEFRSLKQVLKSRWHSQHLRRLLKHLPKSKKPDHSNWTMT